MEDKLKPYMLSVQVLDENHASVFILKLPVFKGDVTPVGVAFPTLEKVTAFLAGL